MKLLKVFKKKPYFKPVVLTVLIALILPMGISLSRFVLEIIRANYLESKNFYFNSNRLKKNNPLYKINNWSGVGNFPLEITVNSSKNNLLSTASDITYNITYTCSNDVICSSSKTNGVIYQATHTDSFSISITPTRVFEENEVVSVHVEATSVAPYTEMISADFQIIVGKKGISYTIDDEINRPYLLVSITNALTSYEVKEAFASYSVGAIIDDVTYRSFAPANQSKCVSAYIELTFDPREVVIDTTSSVLSIGTSQSEIIGGVSYINQVTFPINAMTSKEVRFYKIEHSADYSYPYVNQTPVVSLDTH